MWLLVENHHDSMRNTLNKLLAEVCKTPALPNLTWALRKKRRSSCLAESIPIHKTPWLTLSWAWPASFQRTSPRIEDPQWRSQNWSKLPCTSKLVKTAMHIILSQSISAMYLLTHTQAKAWVYYDACTHTYSRYVPDTGHYSFQSHQFLFVPYSTIVYCTCIICFRPFQVIARVSHSFVYIRQPCSCACGYHIYSSTAHVHVYSLRLHAEINMCVCTHTWRFTTRVLQTEVYFGASMCVWCCKRSFVHVYVRCCKWALVYMCVVLQKSIRVRLGAFYANSNVCAHGYMCAQMRVCRNTQDIIGTWRKETLKPHISRQRGVTHTGALLLTLHLLYRVTRAARKRRCRGPQPQWCMTLCGIQTMDTRLKVLLLRLLLPMALHW